MDIKQQQEAIVASMKAEVSKQETDWDKKSSFLHSVWFQPATGRFIFNDLFTRYEVIEPLIEDKTLQFKGVEQHQDEQMLRYVLSQEALSNKN